jgi:hypothetical protein
MRIRYITRHQWGPFAKYLGGGARIGYMTTIWCLKSFGNYWGGGGAVHSPAPPKHQALSCTHAHTSEVSFKSRKISIYGKQNLISQAYSAVVGNVFTQRRYTIYLLKGQTRDASFIY